MRRTLAGGLRIPFGERFLNCHGDISTRHGICGCHLIFCVLIPTLSLPLASFSLSLSPFHVHTPFLPDNDVSHMMQTLLFSQCGLCFASNFHLAVVCRIGASVRSPMVTLWKISNLCDLSQFSVNCNYTPLHATCLVSRCFHLIFALHFVSLALRCPLCSQKYDWHHPCTFASCVDPARDAFSTGVASDLHHVFTLVAEREISWHTHEPMTILKWSDLTSSG